MRRRVRSITAIMISMMMLSLYAVAPSSTPLPEEIAAPMETREIPAVRYWKTETRFELPTTLVPTRGEGVEIPVRKNPKIVPVLYHNIVFGRTGNVYNRDIYNFEHDLAFLLRNYAVIDFQELLEIREGHSTLKTDATIITFDDGDLSMYAIVYPLLKELQMKATFFLVPNFIGEVGYMSWDQVREMSKYRTESGVKLFTFGSHTLTHRALGDLPQEDIFFEMRESKRILEKETGEPILTLALPFGSGAGNSVVLEAARESGYLLVRTSRSGAMAPHGIDLMNILTFNVENYSTDVFVQHMLRITGR